MAGLPRTPTGPFYHALRRRVANGLGEDCGIVAFAEELLKRKDCTDFDAMQSLVEEAFDRAQKAPPLKILLRFRSRLRPEAV